MENYLTAASILVAVVSGIVAFLHNERVQKRHHTLNLLALLHLDNNLSKANFWMAKRLREGRHVDESDLDEDEDKNVMNLLNYYELVCVAVDEGYLDRQVVDHLRGRLMEDTFNICENYINQRRDKLRRKDLYQRLQKFSCGSLTS